MCPSGNQTEDIRVANTRVMRWANGGLDNETEDWVAREEPLEIRVKGESIVVTMRTPGHDKELAIGFLLAEGVITNSSDVLEIAYCQQGEASLHKNILNVFLSPEVEINLDRLKRNVYASSSCGLCGKASIESLQNIFEPLNKIETVISVDKILTLAQKLRAKQSTFDKTGGLHAAGIFDRNGELLVLREDIGRHNAVDKILGHLFLKNRMPLEDCVLMVSGRASFEIIQKSLAGRVGIICAVSAPSSLAVDMAKESGQTLIGFLRERKFNVYSHKERISGI
ncbi:MAG: sulfurtransferase FdhD [Opitutia bacterium TMED67]|mgnify:FL=1|jgi:FdhD protein|nr:sulfurtransferase FdhD [Verrucomicrobiales bacterium]MAZ12662.1 sulfurtransferase FdhD [Verrucomicrobiales bacterium]OUU69912.1 MAG: sulfurtransferase FdhD [Opitutae bacterium TMED67]RZO61224.1 MAG: formate dehydrogenase accessory sulfurtransferase FdhD [Limisphaerales bacterium]|tara:strand:+ start:7712 stop:8557 length:846 start_codon:yes stop_codon:yes gene_type:complete